MATLFRLGQGTVGIGLSTCFPFATWLRQSTRELDKIMDASVSIQLVEKHTAGNAPRIRIEVYVLAPINLLKTARNTRSLVATICVLHDEKEDIHSGPWICFSSLACHCSHLQACFGDVLQMVSR